MADLTGAGEGALLNYMAGLTDSGDVAALQAIIANIESGTVAGALSVSGAITGGSTLGITGAITGAGITSSAAVQAAAGSGFVVGSSGPKIMSGTGSPEGVVTAPVGSEWIRTDGATLGDFTYQKRSGTGNTGWVVKDGDTGRRNIVSTASVNATATYSVIHLRRVGQVVSLALEIANSVTSTAHEFLPSLPTGFKPATTVTFGGGRNTAALAPPMWPTASWRGRWSGSIPAIAP